MGDQVEERIGRAKGCVVGCCLVPRPKERVEERLPHDSQSFGGQIGQDEQEGGLRDAKTPCGETLAGTETGQAEPKPPASPRVAARAPVSPQGKQRATSDQPSLHQRARWTGVECELLGHFPQLSTPLEHCFFAPALLPR